MLLPTRIIESLPNLSGECGGKQYSPDWSGFNSIPATGVFSEEFSRMGQEYWNNVNNTPVVVRMFNASSYDQTYQDQAKVHPTSLSTIMVIRY